MPRMGRLVSRLVSFRSLANDRTNELTALVGGSSRKGKMRRANARRRLKDNLRARARLSAAALIIYDTRNGIGRIRTYILYNNFQGLINVYYLPRNVMANRPPPSLRLPPSLSAPSLTLFSLHLEALLKIIL